MRHLNELHGERLGRARLANDEDRKAIQDRDQNHKQILQQRLVERDSLGQPHVRHKAALNRGHGRLEGRRVAQTQPRAHGAECGQLDLRKTNCRAQSEICVKAMRLRFHRLLGCINNVLHDENTQ